MQTQLKSEIVAIAHSAVVKQVFKLSKTNTDANTRLFAVGQEMGLRLADEFTERETRSSNLDEVAAAFLKGAVREYMGCEIVVSNNQITTQKNKYTIHMIITVRENPLADFVVLGKAQIRDAQGVALNYHSVLMGFIAGCMRTMAYHPTVTLLADSLAEVPLESSQIMGGRAETTMELEMWKEKEED